MNLCRTTHIYYNFTRIIVGKQIISMLGRLTFTLLLCIIPLGLSAQYEDLDPKRKQATINQEDSLQVANTQDPYAERKSLLDNPIKGIDFSLYGGAGSIFIEGNPYWGYRLGEIIEVCGGPYASLLSNPYYANATFLNVGANAFTRIKINGFFLQGEARITNGVTSDSPSKRIFYTTPIVGLGYMERNSEAYGFLGIALNKQYYLTSPLGLIVYRFGFYF